MCQYLPISPPVSRTWECRVLSRTVCISGGAGDEMRGQSHGVISLASERFYGNGNFPTFSLLASFENLARLWAFHMQYYRSHDCSVLKMFGHVTKTFHVGKVLEAGYTGAFGFSRHIWVTVSFSLKFSNFLFWPISGHINSKAEFRVELCFVVLGCHRSSDWKLMRIAAIGWMLQFLYICHVIYCGWFICSK